MSLDMSLQSKMNNTLYIRGRPKTISTLTATQTCNALQSVIRVHAIEYFRRKRRSTKDLDTCIDEASAVFDLKTLLEF